ncbi:MAG: HipA domain-containing protein [Bacteroidales bacterium]|nr:HipA domain-containing protein [Bacteroidales bacterium]
MGLLTAEYVRGKEIFSFNYSKEWLQSGYSQLLDPDLQFYSGTQYANDEKQNFGVFLDSSPDRWGRLLMRRRESASARRENRSERTLRETDYLLGVFDGHRMGAIRFKETLEGSFLNDNKEFASPPWTSLRELEEISLKLEDDNANENPDYWKWLTMLVNPGSSIGGARPKASVLDTEKNLWIAKFPSKNDSKDIGGWEMVANELATGAGINVAKAKIQKLSNRHHTFLTQRFDRTSKGERIHYASAMTLLGYTDGTSFHDGVSYIELAEFIARHGAYVERDLEELWRRIVFNVIISNTDDHLRNHGFISTDKGWILSPAFDLNPNETGTGLSLNISLEDNSLDLNVALGVIDYFRLDKEKALSIIEQVKKSVSNWRSVANKYKLSRSEQDSMAIAFNRLI